MENRELPSKFLVLETDGHLMSRLSFYPTFNDFETALDTAKRLAKRYHKVYSVLEVKGIVEPKPPN